MGDRFAIDALGPARVRSPINLGTEPGDDLADFTPDDLRIAVDPSMPAIRRHIAAGREPPSLEIAGPRQHIYFEPESVGVGIVTCGGLSPGLNNVIRGLVTTLSLGYGVRRIYGFRYGFAGMNPESGHSLVDLTPAVVQDIHRAGGTILGTSRGPQPVEVMLETLESMGIGILYTIGGDGTFRAAAALHEEARGRGTDLAVVAIPKTIDNDIPMVDRTFGFNTAVAHASEAIQAAYVEASSVKEGVGLVRLMGRYSGFIAANAALANRSVSLVLVPELPFDIEGEQGVLGFVEKRIDRSETTVIVVAEGAGQAHLEPPRGADRSGNLNLSDVGAFLRDAIVARFGDRPRFAMKYVDPGYTIRSARANPTDAIFCGYLAQAAAHAGMAGKTGVAVGRSHNRFTHIPLSCLTSGHKHVDPEGQLWLSVLESTGQPFYMTSRPAKRLARVSYVPQH